MSSIGYFKDKDIINIPKSNKFFTAMKKETGELECVIFNTNDDTAILFPSYFENITDITIDTNTNEMTIWRENSYHVLQSKVSNLELFKEGILEFVSPDKRHILMNKE